MTQTNDHRPSLRLRALCLGIAAAVLMPLLLFSPTTAYAKDTRKPKIVMIGDSYATVAPRRGTPVPWPELTRRWLRIPASQTTIYRHGGYGFAKPHRRFIKLLKKAKKDPTVTDVLIVGGAGNDRRCSKREIIKWYRATIRRLRKLYPNATIMHTVTSWDVNNASYRRLVAQHIPWYRDEAKRLGVTWLHGCETTIYNHPEYFCADGRHPNERGQRAMTKVIVSKIRKYNRRYAK